MEKVDTSLASDLGCDDVIRGESGFISRSDSFSLSLNSGTSLSPTEDSILNEAMAHTDQAEDAQRLEDFQLMPNLTATCSSLESESTQSPLSGSSQSLITNPVSTSPLCGCDDAIALSQVVDNHSTFSPPVENHSTFSVGEELDVKTPQPEAIEPATSRESSEMIHAGMHLRVFSLNQPAALIDSHSQETGVEDGGMVVMNPTALSQTPDLRDTYRHALVTVEEVTPLSELEESELHSLVAAAAIQGHRSFRVKWSLPSPSTVVAAETLRCSRTTQRLTTKTRGKCCDLTSDRSSAASSAVQWNEVQGIVLKIGDRVYWSGCPAHCEQFAPFEITTIDGDYAKLDLFEKPVLLTELHRSS